MMRPRITIHKGIRMLVAVDIGNTNIVLGFLDGDDIIGTYRITTKSNHTSDEYGLMITQFLALSGLRPSDIDDVIIASVVPKVMHSFRASIIKFLNINPMVVGPRNQNRHQDHFREPQGNRTGQNCGRSRRL